MDEMMRTESSFFETSVSIVDSDMIFFEDV